MMILLLLLLLLLTMMMMTTMTEIVLAMSRDATTQDAWCLHSRPQQQLPLQLASLLMVQQQMATGEEWTQPCVTRQTRRETHHPPVKHTQPQHNHHLGNQNHKSKTNTNTKFKKL
jgi:flagellar biosynthesis protein FliP